MRMFRISFASLLMILVAGAAWAGGACDHDKASATSASAAQCGADKASVKTASAGQGCTAAEKAACEAKKAMAGHVADCPFCGFVASLKENQGKVTMTTVEGNDGVTVIFASVSGENVEAAHAIASQAYLLMAGPSHCEVTKAKMANGSCDGCKMGLDAFAKAEITLEKNETGAKALVKTADKAQLEKLHAFFAGLKPVEAKTEG